MDDDKSVVEKMADTVKSAMDTASTAAKKAMEPDPDGIAARANEQLYLPEATAAAVVSARRERGQPIVRANKRVATARARDTKPPAKKAAKKATKKAATKKTAKKAAKKRKGGAEKSVEGRKEG